ncbi:MAG: hypothetical protein KF861_16445, partial [Planctomycetaceae bacterium]|nr:hypothetical protein [Planctomycetaceae bacterium]
MADDLNKSDRDPLDELLASAAWPEPTPAQLERLESTWNRARRGSLKAPIKLMACVSAAAAVIGGLVVWRTIPHEPAVVNVIPAVANDASPVPPEQVVLPENARDDAAKLRDRPATPWELVQLRVAETRDLR